MIQRNCDSMVMILDEAPIDPRTGNKVVYSASWVAERPSMIGERNEDWVRRELDWFNSGSDKLEDMEGPVPALFQACAGEDGKVNSAYGHILFAEDGSPLELDDITEYWPSLYSRVLNTFIDEGVATRHAVIIVSDRDVHAMSKYNGRNDFICTNALNIMIDDQDRLHIIAQMRSMDAVFGYRADYSMWDSLMTRLIADLDSVGTSVTRGDITFQVANLHVYPRHLGLLTKEAEEVDDRLNREARRIWMTEEHRHNVEREAEREAIREGRAVIDSPQA